MRAYDFGETVETSPDDLILTVFSAVLRAGVPSAPPYMLSDMEALRGALDGQSPAADKWSAPAAPLCAIAAAAGSPDCSGEPEAPYVMEAIGRVREEMRQQAPRTMAAWDALAEAERAVARAERQ